MIFFPIFCTPEKILIESRILEAISLWWLYVCSCICQDSEPRTVYTKHVCTHEAEEPCLLFRVFQVRFKKRKDDPDWRAHMTCANDFTTVFIERDCVFEPLDFFLLLCSCRYVSFLKRNESPQGELKWSSPSEFKKGSSIFPSHTDSSTFISCSHSQQSYCCWCWSHFIK